MPDNEVESHPNCGKPCEEMDVVSRHPPKKDGSGLCKKKEWGFVLNGHVFWGYTSKKQAVTALGK